MTHAAVCILLVAGALFNHETAPLAQPGAHAFTARADVDSIADVFVQQGNNLTVLPSAGARAPLAVTLEPGASAFDVADIDGDSQPEIIAVCGPHLRAYPLAPPGPPRTLFDAASCLDGASAEPVPRVLVLQYQGGVVIALPCPAALELRAPDGTLAASFPTGPDAPQRVSMGSPFSAAPVRRPQLTSGAGIEMRVWGRLESQPELPANLLPLGHQYPQYNRAPFAQAARGGDNTADSVWPSFPLETAAGLGATRVLYAPAPNNPLRTVVRLRRQKDPASISDDNTVVGPPRHYPGRCIVLDEDLPDFNGDGYADLLLWSAPEPAASLDALTRAVTGRVWPVRLAAHLYAPQKERFEPIAAGEIALDAPVAGLIAGNPGALPLVLRDFDGDGRTDVACSPGDMQFAAWLHKSTGFAREPDFAISFKEPIESVEFRADLAQDGRTSLCLRTATAFEILRAN